MAGSAGIQHLSKVGRADIDQCLGLHTYIHVEVHVGRPGLMLLSNNTAYVESNEQWLSK